MFFSIPNLRATAVKEIPRPWEYAESNIPDDLVTVKAYHDWRDNLNTKHAFVSTFEGVVKSLRVSFRQHNPPVKMHGVLVDYDHVITDDMIARCHSDPAAEFLPAYRVRTRNNGARLYWAFEAPVLLTNKEQAKQFLIMLQRKLSLLKWLPDLDTAAYGDPCRYYEIGEWHAMRPDAVIPMDRLSYWLYEASRGVSLLAPGESRHNVPLDRVAQEVERRYPGRWHGPFEEGAQGVCFWYDGATNPKSTIVHADGCFCFSDDTGRGFWTWKDIFGKEFVERYEADKLGPVLSKTAFDGKYFWVHMNGRWTDIIQQHLTLYLRMNGFTAKKGPKEECSEIDRAIHAIITQRRVERALPFVNWPGDELLVYEGERYLNISNAKAIEPAPPVSDCLEFKDGKKHFPFIHKIITNLFYDPRSKAVMKDQIEFQLAWLKYAYEGAHNQRPKPGHVMLMAGVVNKGKTLYCKLIVGGLLGGYANASAHLVGGVNWTDDLARKPVLAIEDALATTDHKTKTAFEGRLRAYAANSEMRYDAKYRQVGSVPFFGRIIITCNMDSESLRILPSLNLSSKDKISFFKTSESRIKFPDWETNERLISQELPVFARFLLDWPYPKRTVDENNRRFGVKCYHHPELYQEAQHQGLAGILLEILKPFMAQWKKDHASEPDWHGTASELYQDLTAFNAPAMGALRTAHGLSTCLGVLLRNGYNLRKDVRELNYWTVYHNLFSAPARVRAEEDQEDMKIDACVTDEVDIS